MPSIRVIDIIVVCTRGGRTSIVKSDGKGGRTSIIKSDGRGVDACGGSVSAMGSTEGLLRGGRREPVCQWRGDWTD